jgi:hypothetical protein
MYSWSMIDRRDRPADADTTDADADAADADPTVAELVEGQAKPPDRRRNPDDDLPVVARLMVEIRSDGRRTVARGAIEDAALGHGVAIEAKGNSPLELAMSLARTMFSLPGVARGAARALLTPRRRR